MSDIQKTKWQKCIGIFICVLASIVVKSIRDDSNKYFDIILGSAPSFFYTLGLLLTCSLVEKNYSIKNYLFVFLGSLLYEISQFSRFDNGVFDWFDVTFVFFAFLFFLVIRPRVSA